MAGHYLSDASRLARAKPVEPVRIQYVQPVPSRPSGLLRGLLLLPIARWLVGSPSVPSMAAPIPRQESPRRPTARLIGASLATVALFLSGWLLFVQFNAALPTMGDPPPTGSIHLYFDQPNVTASLDVQVTSELPTDGDDLALDTYAIRVLAEGIDQTEPPRFYLALGGSALPSADGPPASDGEDGGCSWAVSSEAPKLACEYTRGSPESAWVSDERKRDIVVVSGVLEPLDNEQGEGLANVLLSADPVTLVKAGETEVFQLPTIGTTYIPETVGTDDVDIAIDGFSAVKVPGSLTIVVTHQNLAPTDLLDSVSTEPLSRQPLTWIETYLSTLTASGTITDTTEARDADRSSFFWGVIAGVLGGFFVSLIALWWDTLAAWWRWRRFKGQPIPKDLNTARSEQDASLPS